MIYGFKPNDMSGPIIVNDCKPSRLACSQFDGIQLEGVYKF